MEKLENERIVDEHAKMLVEKARIEMNHHVDSLLSRIDEKECSKIRRNVYSLLIREFDNFLKKIDKIEQKLWKYD